MFNSCMFTFILLCMLYYIIAIWYGSELHCRLYSCYFPIIFRQYQYYPDASCVFSNFLSLVKSYCFRNFERNQITVFQNDVFNGWDGLLSMYVSFVIMYGMYGTMQFRLLLYLAIVLQLSILKSCLIGIYVFSTSGYALTDVYM